MYLINLNIPSKEFSQNRDSIIELYTPVANQPVYLLDYPIVARSYQRIDNKRARKMKLRSRASTLGDKMLSGRHSGLSMT